MDVCIIYDARDGLTRIWAEPGLRKGGSAQESPMGLKPAWGEPAQQSPICTEQLALLTFFYDPTTSSQNPVFKKKKTKSSQNKKKGQNC